VYDPVLAGYVIALGNDPIVWESKLQTEIALLTMYAEYITVSAVMGSLINLWNVHYDVVTSFKFPWSKESAMYTVYEDNQIIHDDPSHH